MSTSYSVYTTNVSNYDTGDNTYTTYNDQDDDAYTINLTNPFVFNGTSYSVMYINTNGLINFTSSINNFNYNNITSLFAGFYFSASDLYTGSLPKCIRYKEFTDRFVLIFNSVFIPTASQFQVKITMYLKNSAYSGKVIADFGTINNNSTNSQLGISFGTQNQSNIIQNINFLNYTSNNPYFFIYPNSPNLDITDSQANYSNKQFIIIIPPPAPAFTISPSTQTATVTIPFTGYTIISTGGPIDSYTISPTNLPAGLQFNSVTGLISGTPTAVSPATNYTITAINTGGTATQPYTLTVQSYPCFKEGSKILTDKGYKPIEQLRKGNLVKTLKHGFLPIDSIGKREIQHLGCKKRIKEQLYCCSNDAFEEVFEPLIITGCHSILVDEFISEEQRTLTNDVNGDIFITDDKYRLPACLDLRASVYPEPGTYTIYHLALENSDYYMNYGIYANGLLVETCSKRYLKEFSGMELIE